MKNRLVFGNLRSLNVGQLIVGFVALFHMRQMNSQGRIHFHIFSLPPPPHLYNIGHVYTLFLQRFNIVWGGGGERGKATHFNLENSAFLKLRFKHTEN